MKWMVFVFLLSFQALGQVVLPPSEPLEEDQPITEKVEEKATEIKEEASGTSYYRENSKGTLLLGFEAISSWLPLKFTGSYTYIHNQKWSFEAEVARGKLAAGALGFDVASVTEYRYSILARRYIGNSFNFLMGVYKDDFRAKLGSDVVDDVTGTGIEDLKVEVLGAALGFGNRWQWSNGITLSFDWFRINVPIFDRDVDSEVLNNIPNESDRDAVEKGIERVSNIPTIVLLGLYVGYTF